MCDQLVNTCKADSTALNTCANAKAAASAATPVKTGIQADAFNAVFGIITKFANAPVFDDTGHLVSGNSTNTGNNGGNTSNNGTHTPMNGGNNTCGNGNTTTSNNGNNTTSNNGGNGGNIGNFGSCSVPEIEFGAGFDGRRETAFQPVDLGGFNLFPTHPRYPSLYANDVNLGRSELQPRFCAEYRHHRSIHVRPASEQVRG